LIVYIYVSKTASTTTTTRSTFFSVIFSITIKEKTSIRAGSPSEVAVVKYNFTVICLLTRLAEFVYMIREAGSVTSGQRGAANYMAWTQLSAYVK